MKDQNGKQITIGDRVEVDTIFSNKKPVDNPIQGIVRSINPNIPLCFPGTQSNLEPYVTVDVDEELEQYYPHQLRVI